jgi:hypothetical protein
MLKYGRHNCGWKLTITGKDGKQKTLRTRARPSRNDGGVA